MDNVKKMDNIKVMDKVKAWTAQLDKVKAWRDKWLKASPKTKLFIIGAIVLFLLKRMYNMTKSSFQNKIVLVTGGAMGIGKLMSEKLQDKGAIVVVWDINKQALADMEARGFRTYAVDVTHRDAVFEAQKKIKCEVGEVDVLINNAGVVKGNSLLSLTEKQIRLTMDVNVISHFWTCQAFLPDMIGRNSGHIVTISSIAGFDGLPNLTDYCASKFACRGFAEALRRELIGTNIKTTIVHPFVINTGMFHGSKSSSGLWKMFGSMIEPDYAAQEILNGIANGTIRLILPRRSYYLPAIGEMLPWWARDYLATKSFGLCDGGIKDTRNTVKE